MEASKTEEEEKPVRIVVRQGMTSKEFSAGDASMTLMQLLRDFVDNAEEVAPSIERCSITGAGNGATEDWVKLDDTRSVADMGYGDCKAVWFFVE
jgi:hypothetical protein